MMDNAGEDLALEGLSPKEVERLHNDLTKVISQIQTLHAVFQSSTDTENDIRTDLAAAREQDDSEQIALLEEQLAATQRLSTILEDSSSPEIMEKVLSRQTIDEEQARSLFDTMRRTSGDLEILGDRIVVSTETNLKQLLDKIKDTRLSDEFRIELVRDLAKVLPQQGDTELVQELSAKIGNVEAAITAAISASSQTTHLESLHRELESLRATAEQDEGSREIATTLERTTGLIKEQVQLTRQLASGELQGHAGTLVEERLEQIQGELRQQISASENVIKVSTETATALTEIAGNTYTLTGKLAELSEVIASQEVTQTTAGLESIQEVQVTQLKDLSRELESLQSTVERNEGSEEVAQILRQTSTLAEEQNTLLERLVTGEMSGSDRTLATERLEQIKSELRQQVSASNEILQGVSDTASVSTSIAENTSVLTSQLSTAIETLTQTDIAKTMISVETALDALTETTERVSTEASSAALKEATETLISTLRDSTSSEGLIQDQMIELKDSLAETKEVLTTVETVGDAGLTEELFGQLRDTIGDGTDITARKLGTVADQLEQIHAQLARNRETSTATETVLKSIQSDTSDSDEKRLEALRELEFTMKDNPAVAQELTEVQHLIQNESAREQMSANQLQSLMERIATNTTDRRILQSMVNMNANLDNLVITNEELKRTLADGLQEQTVANPEDIAQGSKGLLSGGISTLMSMMGLGGLDALGISDFLGEKLSDKLGQVMAGPMNKVTSVFGGLKDSVIDKTSSIFGGLKDSVTGRVSSALSPITDRTASIFGGLKDSMVSKTSSIFSGLSERATSIFSGFRDTATSQVTSSLGPITEKVSGIFTGLKSSLSERVTSMLGPMKDGVMNSMTGVKNLMGSGMTNLTGKMSGLLSSGLSGLKSLGTGGLSALQNLSSGGIGSLKSLGSQGLSFLSSLASQGLSSLQGIGGKLANMLPGKQGIGGKLANMLPGKLGGILSKVTGVMGGGGTGLLAKAGGAASSLVSGGGTGLLAKAGGAASSLVSGGSSLLGKAGGAASSLLGAGGMLGGLAKFAGPLGLALTAGQAVMAGVSGYQKAGENFGLAEGQEATTGQKLASGAGGVLSSLSFGLLDEGTAAKGIHAAGSAIGNVASALNPFSWFGGDEEKPPAPIPTPDSAKLATTGQKLASGAGGVLSRLSYGLLDEGTAAKGIHAAGSAIGSVASALNPFGTTETKERVETQRVSDQDSTQETSVFSSISDVLTKAVPILGGLSALNPFGSQEDKRQEVQPDVSQGSPTTTSADLDSLRTLENKETQLSIVPGAVPTPGKEIGQIASSPTQEGVTTVSIASPEKVSPVPHVPTPELDTLTAQRPVVQQMIQTPEREKPRTNPGTTTSRQTVSARGRVGSPPRETNIEDLTLSFAQLGW